MYLQYPEKRNPEEIYRSIPAIELTAKPALDENKSLLIEGENSSVLKYLLEKTSLKGKIDLIYIDPPYATGQVFSLEADRASTVSRSSNGKVAYSDVLKGGDFLEFLRTRLLLMYDLLSERGSLYLHIDTKIGHYVKIILDEIFGIENFRNDITPIKCNPKNFNRKSFGNIKDMILFYSKSDALIWNEVKENYSPADELKLFPKQETDGRRYTTIPLHAPGETRNGNTAHAFKGILPPKGRHWRTDVQTLEQWDEAGMIEWSENGNPRKKNLF